MVMKLRWPLCLTRPATEPGGRQDICRMMALAALWVFSKNVSHKLFVGHKEGRTSCGIMNKARWKYCNTSITNNLEYWKIEKPTNGLHILLNATVSVAVSTRRNDGSFTVKFISTSSTLAVWFGVNSLSRKHNYQLGQFIYSILVYDMGLDRMTVYLHSQLKQTMLRIWLWCLVKICPSLYANHCELYMKSNVPSLSACRYTHSLTLIYNLFVYISSSLAFLHYNCFICSLDKDSLWKNSFQLCCPMTWNILKTKKKEKITEGNMSSWWCFISPHIHKKK